MKKNRRKGGFPNLKGKNIRKGSASGSDRQVRKPSASSMHNPNHADRVLAQMKRSGVGP